MVQPEPTHRKPIFGEGRDYCSNQTIDVKRRSMSKGQCCRKKKIAGGHFGKVLCFYEEGGGGHSSLLK